MGRKKDNKYDVAYGMYLEGLSLQQVANKLNVSRQCIYNAFKKRNFILRGPNFQPYQIYDGKKFTLRNHGYYSLTTNNRCLMHRYVWQKEIGKIPVGFDIHHKNEIKSDNRIENLECLSKSDHTKLYCAFNNQYGNGRRKIEMLDLNNNIIKTFDNTTEAANILNIDRSGINMAINGRLKTYKKHKWKYASNQLI